MYYDREDFKVIVNRLMIGAMEDIDLGRNEASAATLDLVDRIELHDKAQRALITSLKEKLAALQHTGQAMARVEHEYEYDPAWDAESPVYAAGMKALSGKR